MLFYQVELIKHGHDTCLEFMEFAASGDYAETQAHFHSTMEITVIVDGEGFSKAAARSTLWKGRLLHLQQHGAAQYFFRKRVGQLEIFIAQFCPFVYFISGNGRFQPAVSRALLFHKPLLPDSVSGALRQRGGNAVRENPDGSV